MVNRESWILHNFSPTQNNPVQQNTTQLNPSQPMDDPKPYPCRSSAIATFELTINRSVITTGSKRSPRSAAPLLLIMHCTWLIVRVRLADQSPAIPGISLSLSVCHAISKSHSRRQKIIGPRQGTLARYARHQSAADMSPTASVLRPIGRQISRQLSKKSGRRNARSATKIINSGSVCVCVCVTRAFR